MQSPPIISRGKEDDDLSLSSTMVPGLSRGGKETIFVCHGQNWYDLDYGIDEKQRCIIPIQFTSLNRGDVCLSRLLSIGKDQECCRANELWPNETIKYSPFFSFI